MIDVLSRPVSEITIGNIRALIESKIPEIEQVECKETLPAKQGEDPWMSGKNRIECYAKYKILKEVVAFANAYGGVLLLDIQESSTKLSAAAGINSIPKCVDLADRLKLVFRDRVEPPLPGVC